MANYIHLIKPPSHNDLSQRRYSSNPNPNRITLSTLAFGIQNVFLLSNGIYTFISPGAAAASPSSPLHKFLQALFTQ
jgi:hypothetical protein